MNQVAMLCYLQQTLNVSTLQTLTSHYALFNYKFQIKHHSLQTFTLANFPPCTIPSQVSTSASFLTDLYPSLLPTMYYSQVSTLASFLTDLYPSLLSTMHYSITSFNSSIIPYSTLPQPTFHYVLFHHKCQPQHHSLQTFTLAYFPLCTIPLQVST